MQAYEREKVKGAIRTDFILSAEIVAITLGTVASAAFVQQVLVLCGIALVMTLGVYGLVALIVKLDDAGLWLSARPGILARGLGRGLLNAAPWLMRLLSVAGVYGGGRHRGSRTALAASRHRGPEPVRRWAAQRWDAAGRHRAVAAEYAVRYPAGGPFGLAAPRRAASAASLTTAGRCRRPVHPLVFPSFPFSVLLPISDCFYFRIAVKVFERYCRSLSDSGAFGGVSASRTADLTLAFRG